MTKTKGLSQMALNNLGIAKFLNGELESAIYCLESAIIKGIIY